MTRLMALLWLSGCLPSYQAEAQVDGLPEAGAFPHGLLTQALSERVDAGGRIDFAGLRDDRAALDTYVAWLAAASPASAPELFPDRADALAYYLNAYNAFAITGVLERPGMKSVHDQPLRFFYLSGYNVGGETTNLYDLENTVIRGQFHDPRVHFALNCMSVGCPQLPSHALEPETLDAELDAAARRFVTDPSKVRLAPDGRTVEVSEIFQWYAEDFGGEQAILPYVAAHGGAVPDGAALAFIPYDWTLIVQPPPGPS